MNTNTSILLLLVLKTTIIIHWKKALKWEEESFSLLPSLPCFPLIVRPTKKPTSFGPMTGYQNMGFEGEFEKSTPRRWWRGKGWTIPLDDFFEILMFCLIFWDHK